MFWHVRLMDGAVEQGAMPCGRFVLHRHCDADGPHLDLRLEEEGYAIGYRIGGSALEDGAWATEKMPHPVDWLERDGDAVREDSGVYALRAETAEYREVALHGERGVMVLRFEREASLDAAAARAVALALRELRADATQAAPLMRDGMTARRRALERICALGRELDGHVFDEAQWRQMLAPLGLDKLHAQLQSFERRFNAKYPARPVSTPEPLDEAEEAERVLALLRG